MDAVPAVCGVIYDMDGTLTCPYFDWPKLRSDMDIPEGRGILEFLETLPEPERKKREAILFAYEKEAARNSKLQPGVRDVIRDLKKRGILQAVVTNNSPLSADTVFSMHGIAVDILVTREDGPPKPAGDLLLIAIERMGCRADRVLYVGDSIHDVRAAEDAGIRFVLFASNPDLPQCNECIHSFSELLDLITTKTRRHEVTKSQSKDKNKNISG
jgi:HAD superfamily hydrolase (TIGR01509 family)